MNKTYRLLFNKSLGVLQVVSELARSSSTGSSQSPNKEFSDLFAFKRQLLALALVGFCGAIPKQALAQVLPGVNGGSASVSAVGAGGSGAGGGGNGGIGGTDGAAVFGGGGGGGGISSGGDGGNGSSGTGGGAGAVGTSSVNGADGLDNGAGGGGSTKLVIDSSSGTVTNSQNITGGAGGNSDNSSGSHFGGGGGGGVGVYGSSGSILINASSWTITGGSGGSGGASAGAGNGGSGVFGTNLTATNNGNIIGGAGGAGGDSNGTSGTGGAGVGGYGINLTNNLGATIVGGAGGSSNAGGAGAAGVGGNGVNILSSIAVSSVTNSGSINGGAGGGNSASFVDGGSGGAGVNGSNFVLVNHLGATITGGTGGLNLGGSGDGAGGAGVSGSNFSLTNSGAITGGDSGPSGGGNNNGGSGVISASQFSITNNATGTITGGVGVVGYGNGITVSSGGVLTTLTNLGSIIGGGVGAFGVNNAGEVATLNNAQGQGNVNGALTYSGVLPTRYNIIITGANNYGRLAITSGSGFPTTFGISSLSGRITALSYTSVITGISSANLTSTTGSYLGATWSLVDSSSNWDLIFTSLPIYGPSTADTQQSLVNTASALQNIYTLQNTVLANSFAYDCTEFGVNGICISAGGRNTAVSSANGLNNTSGLLIAAYRPHQNYRVGAYVDQNLSVNNAGSTVNLGNNTPLIGVFGAWNERLDGTGTEVKVSAAYGQKNTTINRSAVGTGSAASEAGSGSSQLNSQGAQVTAKYGFGVIDNVIVSPYVGIRYTQNNMGGYTEGASSTVTAPLTYSALNTNATTALAGVGASYRGIPQTTLFASAGVETDTNTANGSYIGTNAYFNGGLTPVNFNANPVKTRPTATLGAYYDVVKNQRIGVTGFYRQEAYQAVSTTTVMATYTVGL